MRSRYALPALAAVAALLLTGCVDNSTPTTSEDTDGSSSGSTVAGVTTDEAAAALLPDTTAVKGKLVFGTSPNYAPNEFKNDAGEPIGWAIDMSDAIAAKLGLEAQYTVARFENIIPGILGGKIDVGESSFTDNVEREKQVDFVNYYVAGIQWASATGNTVDPDDACGLKVAVQSTTYQDTDEIPGKSDACVAAGKPPIQKLALDTQDAAANAVALGQADAFSADSPVTLYGIAQLKGKLQPAGETFDAAPYGLAVAKDTGMAEAVQAALQSLVDDGTYGAILDEWGVADGGLDTITLNAGGKG
ncbi:ABC transporter substrate-binding protein [Cryobacterium cheniae]|uniref:ABC transporter substrate-binding protein n=1 Tax=Cryobacterium cheniae TaxID=1259262 RepID=A0A4R8XVB4_9MICO|nr:ABC transporter substrate-binding protein [Cryobacterium cheniae]TFC82625.1 ABC transporter substrate-binding protein [Cryobacterium cheniae]